MRILKNSIFGLITFVTLSLFVKYVNVDSNLVFKIVIVVLFILFFFSILARRIGWLQPFYTSRFNILTSKFREEKEYDFSKSILFHKILEVLNNSNFRVLNYNEEKGLIIAATNISFLSWGENIYINLEESGKNAIMKFCSTSLFGIYSWGKNEENYKKLLYNFDESLII